MVYLTILFLEFTNILSLKWTEFVSKSNVFSEKQMVDRSEFFPEINTKINVIFSWIVITKFHFPFSLEIRKENRKWTGSSLKKALS